MFTAVRLWRWIVIATAAIVSVVLSLVTAHTILFAMLAAILVLSLAFVLSQRRHRSRAVTPPFFGGIDHPLIEEDAPHDRTQA